MCFNFFSHELFISILILIRFSLPIHYIHINKIKYFSDDLKNNLIKITFNTISNPEKPINKYKPPIVYILNATSLVKPHGIENLRFDDFQLRPDIVIITESWLESHQSDGLITFDGSSSFKKDRVKKVVVVY